MLHLFVDKIDIVNKIWIEAHFFFNQYMFYVLQNNKEFDINQSTTTRCALFVLNKASTIKNKSDQEFKIMTHVYENIYKPLGTNNIEKYNNVKSIVRPFEYLSKDYIVNIINHCQLNFVKFQKKYIKYIVTEKLSNFKINKNTLKSITNCIQAHINSKADNLYIRSKYIRKLPNIQEIAKIMISIINDEIKNMPKTIIGNVSRKRLKSNYIDVIKYYYFILNKLEANQKKRFSLLPQIKLGYTYINFDSRFLSTIYDEWINEKIIESKTTSIKAVQNKYDIDYDLEIVGIKHFEANYNTFIKRMINFVELRTNLPFSSLQTNGYSVCLLFDKGIKVKPKVDENNDEEKEKLNLDEHFSNTKTIKGLFDSDYCTASTKFLDQFHLKSFDPNNKIMFYGCSETEIPIKVSKGYYNEVSHITKNTRKMKRYIKEDNMSQIYELLANTSYKKTVKINEYNEYILIIRENWNSLWSFYKQNKLLALELDTFINKKKAQHKIIRKLIPKNKKTKFNKYNSRYVVNKDDIVEKPPLIFFGKGNGTTTISNLKNSSAKGPIKTIVKELSKFCPVILVDEFRTSKLCSDCKDHELIHPLTDKIKKTKIETENETTIIEKIVKVPCHGLCYCKNNVHSTQPIIPKLLVDVDIHKIWNRDYNASRNIMYVGKSKLLNMDIDKFNRKKVMKEYEKEEAKIKNEFSWPMGRHCPEKGKAKEVIKKM